MKKPSEYLKDVPVLGSYIRFEKNMVEKWNAQAEAARLRRKNHVPMTYRFGRWLAEQPGISQSINFLSGARDWLEDLPVLGPLVFRQSFRMLDWAGKGAAVGSRIAVNLAVPWSAAAMVSLALVQNPDTVSTTPGDYLKENGLSEAIFADVAFPKIRVYDGNIVTTALHAGMRATQTHYDISRKTHGPLRSFASAAISYPSHVLTMGTVASLKDNAFALPSLDPEGTCFIRPIHKRSDPLKMMASLSQVPQKYLNLDKEQIEKWLPSMVLAHEAKHCDNGLKTYALMQELETLRSELGKVKQEEVRRIIGEGGENFDRKDLPDLLKQSEAYKEAQEQYYRKKQEVSRATLAGEMGSDYYTGPVLGELFPDENAARMVKYARAIVPFAGNMNLPLSHATASALDSHLRDIEQSDAFDIWDAITMARYLVSFGALMNDPGVVPVTGFDKTLQNYHIAKDVVIPWLEMNRDNYLLRDERHVRFELVLDQVRMFVEGMESLVKPEALEKQSMDTATAIPGVPGLPALHMR